MQPEKQPTVNPYAEAARLREALREFNRRSETVTRANGLTPQRYELLLMTKTARDGGDRVTLRELGERLQLAASTATELVHRCEEAGLITREVDARRRGVLYFRATKHGERHLERAWAELQGDRDRLRAILHALDAADDRP